jgi:hypothetical protein
VTCFAGWMRGWGRLAMSYQHHHWIGVDRALVGHRHSKRWFWICWHRIHVIIHEELPESWVLNIALSIQSSRMKTCIHTITRWFKVSCLMIIIVSNTVSGFYGNMNVIQAFWSTSCSWTKQHSHVKVSSAVTTATCGHSIIPM